MQRQEGTLIVLGLDPGTRRTGYCVVESRSGASLKILDSGIWILSPTLPLGDRLEKLYLSSCEILKKWNPRVVGLEKAVVFKNVPTSLILSEARGVLRLAIYNQLEAATERLVELSPTFIKKTTTGRGHASKDSVKRSLALRWGLKLDSDTLQRCPSDVFDALAIATSAALVHKRNDVLKTRPTLFFARRRKKRLDFEPAI